MSRAPRRLALVAFAVSFVAAAGAPRLAHACSPPRSCEAVVPGEGGSFPASVPAIPVASQNDFGPVDTNATPATLQLRTASGTIVPGALETDAAYHRFFLPAAPLAPGAYTLSLVDGCAGAAGSSFTVSASQPVPTNAGALRVVRAARQAGSASTSSGSCTEPVDAGVVDLALDIDAGSAPYASVLAWKVKVDGKHWWEATGELHGPDASSEVMHGALRLFTACDVGSTGRDNGLAAGVHDVELTPTLVGSSAVITPAKLRVKVTCGADNGEVLAVPPPTVPPPGDQPPGGDQVSAPPPGAGTGAATPADEASSRSDGGCSASPRTPAGGALAAIAGAAVALSLFAARRKRAVSAGRRARASQG